MPAAANLFGRAVSLLPVADPTRLQLALELFDTQMEIGDFKAAEAVVGQTLRAAEVLGDERLQARAAVQRAYLLHHTESSEIDELAETERLKEIFEKTGDDYGLAKVYQLVAEVYWDQLNTGAALDALEMALQHARSGSNKHDEFKILAWIATGAFWGPVHVDEGLSLCEEIDNTSNANPLVEARCLWSRAGLQAMKGNFDEARTLFAKARNIQTEFGQTLALAFGTQISGLIELLADEPSAAEQQFRQGYEKLEEMGERPYLATQAALLARSLYTQDRYEEAERYTELSETASDGDEASKAEWGPTRARVMARRGEIEPAEHLAREAVAIAKMGDDVISTANSLMGLAEILLLSGRAEQAHEPIEEAFKLYEGKGVVPWMEKTRALLERFSA
jgi:tetratricopeptide (TPR) repeat protein